MALPSSAARRYQATAAAGSGSAWLGATGGASNPAPAKETRTHAHTKEAFLQIRISGSLHGEIEDDRSGGGTLLFYF